MKSLFVLFFALSALPAAAAPFLVADLSDQSVTHCGYALDGGARTDVAVATEGAAKVCKVDLANVAVGSHTATLTSVRVDATWGRQESAPSGPFAFQRPAVPATASGLRLAP